MSDRYTSPVSKLLTYRRLSLKDFGRPWPDYLKLGLSREHVPELIAMGSDSKLNAAAANNTLVWAPLHAWRALAQLRAVEAVEPLFLQLQRDPDDDWLNHDLRAILSLIGPAAIPALEAYLGDDAIDESCRISIPECLVELARDHPAERDRCAGVLVRRLEAFATTDPEINAFVVWGLMDLGATEAIDLIRRAFAENRVAVQVVGDVEDVEMALGLRTERSTPPPRYFPTLPGVDRHADDQPVEPMTDRAFGYVPVRQGPKVGRNDPCPCGSGKKYKKCCLNNP